MERSLSRQTSNAAGLPPGTARVSTPTRTSYGAPPLGPGSLRQGSFAPVPSRGGPRPPSARSISTARPGTPSNAGLTLNTDVQVDNRPVTQQGVMGMRSRNHGPGRQVLDRSYFLTRLRTKKQELQAELESLTAEMERYQRDDTKSAQLERRCETSQREVKTLRAQLADYNLVLDKLVSDEGLEQTSADLKALKERNDREKRRIDGHFTEKAAKDAATREAEGEMASIQRTVDQKLTELAPDKRSEYLQLRAEGKQLGGDMAQLELQLEELNHSIAALEQELAGAGGGRKQRALGILEQLRAVKAKCAAMEADEGKAAVPAEDARDAMLQRLRRDRAEAAQAEEQVQELDAQVARLTRQLADASSELTKQLGGDADGYMELQAHQREMQEFIDGFERAVGEEAAKAESAQQAILPLLEHISQAAAAKAVADNRRRAEARLGDLSRASPETLHEELVERRSDLRKIQALEAKILAEMSTLQQRMATLRAETARFSHISEFKQDLEGEKKELKARREAAAEARTRLQGHVAELAEKLEGKRRQLRDSEVREGLEKLEAKMTSLEQQIFQMSDYIEAKERETNYKAVLFEVTNLAGQLNLEIQKQCMV